MSNLSRVLGTLVAGVIIVLVGILLVQSQPSLESDVGAVSPTPASLRPSSLASAAPALETQAPSPSDTEPPAGSLAPHENGLACGLHVTDVLLYANFFEVANLTGFSTAVVTGTVVEVGPGSWATADGKPPVDEYGMPPTALEVYRLIKVTLADVAKRPVDDTRFQPDSSISVRVLGGKVGCLDLRFSRNLEFELGDQVALFLGEQPALALAPAADIDVIDAWPISDGVVYGPQASLTVDELLRIGAESP